MYKITFQAEFHKYFFVKSFTDFTGKTPVLDSIFKKITVTQACNFIKKRHQHSCFLVKFAKSLKELF